MRDSWLELVDRVLCPASPDRERCLREAAIWAEESKVAAAARLERLLDCQNRITRARWEVFQAADGVVSARMTELEREWRVLERRDPDGYLMGLWSRLARPARLDREEAVSAWVDRKPWRDSPASAQRDAAMAIASDFDGVEAAESAVLAFRRAMAPWGITVAERLQWRSFESDRTTTTELLAEPLRAARAAVEPLDYAPVALERSDALANEVERRASARFPGRPALVHDLAEAARLDVLFHAAAAVRPNPVTPLKMLWKTGYVLARIDEASVTLELPAFAADG